MIFNKNEKADFYIFIYNAYKYTSLMRSLLMDVKATSPESKIIIYYFEKSYVDNKDILCDIVNKNVENLEKTLDGFFYSYFLYFRHTYFIL